MSRKGGIISGGFQPLKAPDAPTIDSVSAGVLSADVTFSAPSDTGDGTIDSYVITAKQSDGTSASATASAAGTTSVSLTVGGTTTFAAQALSEYGPGQFSGFGNSTAVPSGQELYTWGQNNNGQLGQNNTINLSSPVQVGALTTWSQATAGATHTAAIKTDGTLWAWGSGEDGRLGTGNTTNRSSPVQVGALTTWYQVAVRNAHAAAIKTDGTLWTWGANNQGQLGQNTQSAALNSPVQVGALTSWSQVSIGNEHTAAIKTDGTLWTWGFNGGGVLGIGDIQKRSSPVQVGALTTWSQVSAGTNQTAAIKTDGTLWTWGDNGSGQLGQNIPFTTDRSSPVQVGALTTWSQISSGNNFMAAVRTDGTLWTWGNYGSGRLGHNDVISRSSPVQVGSLTTWSYASAGSNNVMAIKTDGTLWAWGLGNSGQLGQSNTTTASSPVQVGALTSWSQASAGGTHIIALELSFT